MGPRGFSSGTVILETTRQHHPQLLTVYCTRNWQFRGKALGITKQSDGQPRATKRYSVDTCYMYTHVCTHTRT